MYSEILKSKKVELQANCKNNLPKFNEANVIKAFEYCIKAHDGRLRSSGRPYWEHPVEVANIVAKEIKLDEISVIAGLLIDIATGPDDEVLLDIKREFGATVYEIVKGFAAISHLEKSRTNYLSQLENYRKILLSLFTDFRIILIKLASRINNLRNIEYLPFEHRKLIADETMELYIPYANRFGLNSLKWELEDLSFKQLNRPIYDEISNKLHLSRKERVKYVEEFIKPIEEKLNDSYLVKDLNIKFSIKGRAKHIYSIYNKTILRNKPMEELYDLFAIRLILETSDPYHCFYAYAIAAAIYPPVPETFKDYISDPKQNGYQSIHVALKGPGNKPVEVQIRTETMHKVAEEGVAAHFEYKSGLIPAQSVLNTKFAKEWMDSIREILERYSDESPEKLLESVKKNVFLDQIHVFSPKNQLITLPKGASPLDFAFYIHSDLGYKCIGAKVNGKIEPLEYKLETGDQIEIITSAKSKPSSDWLEYVITGRAKSQIRKYLASEKKKRINEGSEKWKAFLRSKGTNLRPKELQKILKVLNLESKDILMQSIGDRSIELSYLWSILLYLRTSETGKININSPAKSKNNIYKYFKLVVTFEDIANLSSGILENIVRHGSLSVYYVNLDKIEGTNSIEVNFKALNEFDIEGVCEKVNSLIGVKNVSNFVLEGSF